MALIELKGVSRIYTGGEHVLRALDGVDLSIEKGKFVVILGPAAPEKVPYLTSSAGWTARMRVASSLPQAFRSLSVCSLRVRTKR